MDEGSLDIYNNGACLCVRLVMWTL